MLSRSSVLLRFCWLKDFHGESTALLSLEGSMEVCLSTPSLAGPMPVTCPTLGACAICQCFLGAHFVLSTAAASNPQVPPAGARVG